MDTPSRTRLGCEALLLYVVLPVALCLVRWYGGAFPVLPVLWLAAVPAAHFLARQGFDRRDFLGWHGLRQNWRGLLLRVAVAAGIVAGLVLLLEPAWFLALPRHSPLLWLLIMLLYPLASVYPQGIVYRALFYRRYAGLWRHPLAARLAGALAFSLGHLFFLNPWALALTLMGGWFFNRTYERTRSLPVANLEHALCGCLIFTLGLGRFFYHGTLVLVQSRI